MPTTMPERIGSYVIRREIGQGGMGVVYLAAREEQDFSRIVALKVVKRGMDTSEVLRRFNLERQLLSGLNHPNIATLIDGGATEDGLPYFVLEYVEGQPIDKYCDLNRLTVAERLGLFKKVCAAVHHAHQNLIVHRDLKPGNILVTKEGEPKLLDFGIAKMLNPNLAQMVEVTGPELRLMTPEYASPEQVRGDPITTSSDIYALGVLLYELLTGRKPYRFRTRMQQEIARVICESDPERPSTVVTRMETIAQPTGEQRTITPDEVARSREDEPTQLRRKLAGDIDDIVMMAMEKVPSRRYASAASLSADLDRHLQGLPVEAHGRRGVTYVLGKFVRRHRLPVAFGAALLLAIVAGAGFTLWQWRRAEAANIETRAALAESERRFGIVRDLASTFMRESGGSTYFPNVEERRAMVAATVKGLEALEAGTPDATLKASIAAAYQRLGDITGGLRTQNLGDPKAASEYYRKALALRQSLLDAGPEVASHKADLAISHRAVGDVIGKTGAPTEERLAAYEKAAELLRGLPAFPDREKQTAVEGHLASVLMSIGGAKATLGDLPGADAAYKEAALAREKAYRAEKSKASRREYAAALAAWSDVARRQGDGAAALERLRQAQAMRDEALREFPDDQTALRDAALGLARIADASMKSGDAAANQASLSDLAKAEQMFRASLEKDAANERHREDLGTVLELRAKALRLLERWQEAADTSDAQTVNADAILKGKPDNAIAKLQSAASRVASGRALTKLGRTDAALERLRDGVERWGELAAKDQKNIETQRNVAVAFASLGDAAAAHAARPGATDAEKRSHRASASVAYGQALEKYGQFKAANQARPDDDKTIAELEAKLREFSEGAGP
ncbi:MAG: protein kinase domain-containing protein [Phycisphaerales bacterium]